MSHLPGHVPSQPLSTPPSSSTEPFAFPREYHYPPFFTRQPILQTLNAQLTKWSLLILSYCRSKRIYKLSLIDALETELFYNRTIGKKVDLQLAKEVIDFMRGQGRAEWVGAPGKESYGFGGAREGKDGLKEDGKSVCWVYWRNPSEWATEIADWVDVTGQKNTVLTLYELTESEATVGQEFHGMDPELLQKALSVLVKRGKAQIFGQDDGQGIKFF